MNLTPAAESLVESVQALQDYMNSNIENLNNGTEPISPDEFKESLHNHYCDFLDTSQSVETVLESAVEKISKSYANRYSAEYGTAVVYDMQEYRNKKSELYFDPMKYATQATRKNGVNFD